MENKDKEMYGNGIIPRLIKKWVWRKKFTKEEKNELDKIKKESFMKKMREKAKLEGEKKADEGEF